MISPASPNLPPTEPGEDSLPNTGPKSLPEDKILATQEAISTNRRSNLVLHPVERLIEAMTIEIKSKTSHDVGGKIFFLSAMFPKEESIGQEDPLLAYRASADLDTL